MFKLVLTSSPLTPYAPKSAENWCRPLRRAALAQGRLFGTRFFSLLRPGTSVPGNHMPPQRGWSGATASSRSISKCREALLVTKDISRAQPSAAESDRRDHRGQRGHLSQALPAGRWTRSAGAEGELHCLGQRAARHGRGVENKRALEPRRPDSRLSRRPLVAQNSSASER